MQTGALTASAAHAADTHTLAFDQVKERFLEMFPRRSESIWKRRGQRRWFTQHTAHLSDQQILDAAQGKLQRFVGARFGHRTHYAVLDIDTISPYYNVLSLVRLRRALEIAGLAVTHHYQSSDSGGWHLWIFFDEAVDSTELNKFLAAWLKKQGFKLGSGVLEIFPSANGLRLPLQPGFAWLSNGTQRNQLTFEQALRRFICDASCTNNWQGAFDYISANLVTPTSERHANKRRSGLIQERWKLGQELWRTGLQFWGQRHDAMLAVEHYLWFGDDDANVEALPGYNNDAARGQLITDWLERKHNGMCRHINRGDWKKVSADIQRACAWRPSVHVHTPYAHTDRKIERMMENPSLTPKRFVTGNIARYNYALARITSAFNELANSGRTPSINEVAEKAGAHWNTVRKHWNILTASSSDQSPGNSPDAQVVRSLAASVQSLESSSRVSLDGLSALFAPHASSPLVESSLKPSNSVDLLLNFFPVSDIQTSEKVVRPSLGLSSHFCFEHTKNLAFEQSRLKTVSAPREYWCGIAPESFDVADQKTLKTHKLADGALNRDEKTSLPISRNETLKCFLNEPGEAFPENPERVCKGSVANINHRQTNFFLESDTTKCDTTLNVQVLSAAIATGEIQYVEILRSAEILTCVDESPFKSAANAKFCAAVINYGICTIACCLLKPQSRDWSLFTTLPFKMNSIIYPDSKKTFGKSIFNTSSFVAVSLLPAALNMVAWMSVPSLARLSLPEKLDESVAELVASGRSPSFPSPYAVNRWIQSASNKRADVAVVMSNLWSLDQPRKHVAAEAFHVLNRRTLMELLFANFVYAALLTTAEDSCIDVLQNQYELPWEKSLPENQSS